MSPTPAVQELDERFPSGEWIGFFFQPDSRRRYVMDLFLRFADGQVYGNGLDAIAQFVITGWYDTASGNCDWHKQYHGMHQVIYTGRAAGGGIIGDWSIRGNPPSWTGPFFVWPRAASDLSAGFEQAFTEWKLDRATTEFAEEPVAV